MNLFDTWDRRNQRVLERANRRAADDSSDASADVGGGLFQLGGELGTPVGLALAVIGGIVALVGFTVRLLRRRGASVDS